jgi:DNA polymerase III alpha subunit
MNQTEWMMPDDYKNMAIETYLMALCKTVEEQQRVGVELELFRQHHMVEVLKYLKYLVDYMREHKIVWGLGRGSSVASYCLYLIGIHKIDSIKYQLDIKEFLKGENDGKENL